MHDAMRTWKSRVLLSLMGLALLLCVLPVISLLVTLIGNGSQALSVGLLTRAWAPVGEPSGIAHAILGSCGLLLIASCLAIPLGLAHGLFLSYGRRPRLAAFTRILLDVMSGVPAIVVGVFVYTVVVRRGGLSLRAGFSMLAGGLALGMIMLPVFARAAEEALRAIPQAVEEAGLALGVPRRRVLLRIVLRAAFPAVVTAAFLALARVAGEAAPLLFTAFGSNDWPRSPIEPVSSLPQLLFDYSRQPFKELVVQAWGAALVLVTMVVAMRAAANWCVRRRRGGEGAV